MTGSESAFGRQMKNGAEMAVADINAGGGVLGKKLMLDVGDDACDPKQARSVAEKIGRREDPVRGGPLLLVVLDPGLRGLCRKQCAADHAGLDQSAFTERKLGTSRALRPRRPARQVAANTSRKISRARTSRSSTTRRPTARALPTRPRRRSTRPGVTEKLFESYNKGDKDFNADRLPAEAPRTSIWSMSAAIIRKRA